MVGKWIDAAVVILLVVGIWRGFRRGLIREVFSLLGVLLAVVIAFQRYQELSLHLMVSYPLKEWQAQLIAFFALALGISLLAVLFGYFWSRIIRITPFALIDNIAGAGFGVAKIMVVVITVVVVLNSLSISPVDQVLAESYTAQQVSLIWPHVNQWLDRIWPDEWARPGWLFPPINLENASLS